jgi:SAM-dependent methyltransferase
LNVSLTAAAIVALGGPGPARAPGCVGGSSPPRELRDVARDLLAAARAPGVRLAVLVGGEPLARPDLPGLLRLVEKVGLATGLATDGARLISPALRRLLADRGVAYLRVALHGASAATHDALAGERGSFDRTMEGLAAALAELPESALVDVALTVAATNLGELEAAVEAVAALRRRTGLGLRLVAPLGGLAEDAWPESGPAAAAVAGALRRAGELGADVVATWEGFAPCTLPDSLAHLRDETLRWGAPLLGPAEAATAVPREAPGDRRRPPACLDCAHGDRCPGAPAALVEREGEAALRPARGAPRANSFNYELQRTLPGVTPRRAACPVPGLDLPGGGNSPVRSVLLVEPGGAGSALYHTPTADFGDEAIAAVKLELEQLYLDVGQGAGPDDFTRGVRRLRLHPECRGCADRAGCPRAVTGDGLAEPGPGVEENPFRREESWIRAELSRVQGRVLDVGCGELLYREELRRPIEAGRVEYLGLDPDEGALERLRSSGFPGAVRVGEIETFEPEPGAFDYVIAFRSLNHFRDVELAFRVITRALRPGGQLLLCDSPVFALLRTRAQVDLADRRAAGVREHFRNWTSYQVMELLRRFPLRLNLHRPVTAETANQWSLKYIREPDPGPRWAARG